MVYIIALCVQAIPILSSPFLCQLFNLLVPCFLWPVMIVEGIFGMCVCYWGSTKKIVHEHAHSICSVATILLRCKVKRTRVQHLCANAFASAWNRIQFTCEHVCFHVRTRSPSPINMFVSTDKYICLSLLYCWASTFV